ncbi:hypothetical protein KCU85_g5348, partial [Aureobasidium melanogenum]
MNYHPPTVSAELDSEISRYNILNYCSIILPGKTCSIVVAACYTCRMRGHQQYQAKLIVDGRCILRGGCKSTNEEALAGLHYWLQRRADQYHRLRSKVFTSTPNNNNFTHLQRLVAPITTMTGPNREVIKRRFRRIGAFFKGRATVRKADKAESAGGWTLCRGLHQSAQEKFPEYGDKYQVHVQKPFDKVNLYTATLTILGEDEPLLQTKFCPTPVEALSNLRIMIMVCEDPNTKAKKLAEQHKNEERAAEKDVEKEHAIQEIDEGPVDSEESDRKQREDAMRAEKERLAREQWDSLMTQLGSKSTSRR